MSDKKLLPCPFCGGEAEIKTKWKANGDCITKAECFCGASLEIIGSIPYTEELQKRWNTRKPMEKIVERLEESKGTYIDEHGKELYQEDYFIDIDEAIEIVKEEGGFYSGNDL